jgi:hypothetical protein
MFAPWHSATAAGASAAMVTTWSASATNDCECERSDVPHRDGELLRSRVRTLTLHPILAYPSRAAEGWSYFTLHPVACENCSRILKSAAVSSVRGTARVAALGESELRVSERHCRCRSLRTLRRIGELTSRLVSLSHLAATSESFGPDRVGVGIMQ